MSLTPRRPYILKAMYEWIVDNGLTPHILVNAQLENVMVPLHAVQDGFIRLSISMSATHGMKYLDDGISFSARFNGKSENIFVPWVAVLEICAAENGEGFSFVPVQSPDDGNAFVSLDTEDETLLVTSADENASAPTGVAAPLAEAAPTTEVGGANNTSEAAEPNADAEKASSNDSEPEPEPPQPPRGRPSLKVVK